ncbi:MAG: aspartate kinase [Salinivirgaceae bacterium]|nr:aspartate kinase [Salinivirgaceae bacterium]
MIINKFGGVSIKDTASVQRMAKICSNYILNGVIVVSAMGKMTNMLESLAQAYFAKKETKNIYNQFVEFHTIIIKQLFQDENHEVFKNVDVFFKALKDKLSQAPELNYDFEYDQIVPFGELLATTIVSQYLNLMGQKVIWRDIRKSLKTDHTYRDAKVDWKLSEGLTKTNFNDLENTIYLTQGYIGSDSNNMSTSLGREGSDYTAAILANILNAEKVVVWKDVLGVMCADPQWIPNAPIIPKLSYLDAIELAFFGAKVIHPKTIKPLQNKNIPLQVRSFISTDDEGTIINKFENFDIPPVYIKKEKQVLISIKPFDFSFIVEENLSHIFGILAAHQIKVNLMQNSAISFSIVVDNELGRVDKVIKELKKFYNVKYNELLELITIRHNKPGAEYLVLNGRKILVEQKSRMVARFVVQ